MYALYGTATFANTRTRDRILGLVRNEATARGFIPGSHFGFAAGAQASGTTSMTVCFEHADVDVVDATQAVIMAEFAANSWSGDFGSQLV